MSWPVIVYIAAPVGSLLLLVLTGLLVWRRIRSLLRDVQETGARAAAAGQEAAALAERLDAVPTG